MTAPPGTSTTPQIVLKPIGTVHNQAGARPESGWEEFTSEIVIDEGLTEHLEGLEEFSHIVVLFWMHACALESPPPTKVHPRGRADLPLVGLFASRAPHRPNSLGMTVAKLVERHNNILTVTGLDAIDGTPVIDIKPYMPLLDNPDSIRLPGWVAKLRTSSS
jgi:tRNA (adenine37-N6)-methyltransferase